MGFPFLCAFLPLQAYRNTANKAEVKKEQGISLFPISERMEGWHINRNIHTTCMDKKCEYSVTTTVSLQMQSGKFFVAGSWTENPTSLP